MLAAACALATVFSNAAASDEAVAEEAGGDTAQLLPAGPKAVVLNQLLELGAAVAGRRRRAPGPCAPCAPSWASLASAAAADRDVHSAVRIAAAKLSMTTIAMQAAVNQKPAAIQGLHAPPRWRRRAVTPCGGAHIIRQHESPALSHAAGNKAGTMTQGASAKAPRRPSKTKQTDDVPLGRTPTARSHRATRSRRGARQ